MAIKGAEHFNKIMRTYHLARNRKRYKWSALKPDFLLDQKTELPVVHFHP